MRNAAFWTAVSLFLLSIPRNSYGGVVSYLDVPAIPGAGAPQKYPTSMQIQSFSWTPKAHDFSVTRVTDANSPIFQSDAISGTVLHNVIVLLYKTANEMHDPYVTYSFGDSVVSSFGITGSGQTAKDNIHFAYQTDKILYLKIPGLNGEASPPGYSNVLALNSITFDSSGLTLSRDLDSASPSLSADVIAGKDLGTASLLIYNLPNGGGSPVDPPYDIVNFSHLTAAAYQTTSGSTTTTEQVAFAFSDFNDAPEPGTLAVMGIGIIGLVARPVRRG